MMMQIRIMRGRGVAFMFLDKGSTGNDHDDDGYGGYRNNVLQGSMAWIILMVLIMMLMWISFIIGVTSPPKVSLL